jgi:hypothetical protein
MQYLTDNFAVGNHDNRLVGVRELRREEIDRLDHAAFTEQVNEFAYAKRLGKNNQKASHKIGEHSLCRETDADTDHADTRDQGSYVHPHFGNGENACEQDDYEFRQADEQRFNRLFNLEAGEGLLHEAPQSTGNKNAANKDDYAPENLESVLNKELYDLVFNAH